MKEKPYFCLNYLCQIIYPAVQRCMVNKIFLSQRKNEGPKIET